MIELINGYYIQVDPLSYNLVKRVGTDKDGKPTYRIYGYFSSLESCIERCKDLIQKDKLSQGTFSLTEALRAIKEVETEFKTLLKKAMEEIKK